MNPPVLTAIRHATVSLVLAAASAAVIASPALAQTAACRTLQAQLDAPRTGAGTSAAYRDWDSKVDRQRAAIRQTERQARAGSCLSGRGAVHPRCGQILATLDRMHDNLGKLERRRDRYAGRTGPGPAPSLIRQRMRDLGCGPAGAQARRAEPGPVRVAEARNKKRLGFFARIFGPPRDSEPEPRSRVRFAPRRDVTNLGGYRRLHPRDGDGIDFYDEFSHGSWRGTYRTICVRRCDGYYFPISFSTTDALFSRDADMCSRLCPAGDAELFVHDNPGGSPETMTALDGRAYSELPTAFKYRRSYDKDCTCRSPATAGVTTLRRLSAGPGFHQIGGAPQPSAVAAVTPIAKRPSGLDPDSRVNLLAGYRPIERAEPVPTVTAGNRTIRIVGPKYYYAK